MTKEIGTTRENGSLSSSAHNFPIVGIGASAGGLDAFKELLEAIPVDSEMAYVVVQHLNPDHDSALTEILSRVTKIPIEEITDEVKIYPNHIYVMPSGKILTSVDGVLKLTPRDGVKTNLVIDIFFTSIAVVWESMAVGVVLSGTGADGTVGLKMIKEHGGTTIVQDESADYDGMPQSAVDANVVDFVLPAGKIPATLLKINNAHPINHKNADEEPVPLNDEVVFKQILKLLQQRSGVDFTNYKQSTVQRRIGRRMALHKRGNLADYLKYLQSDIDAQDALFKDMLIHVTSFFRDLKTFEALTEKVLPALLKGKPAESPIRFWIAGCATGEEAYSIAICLHEYLNLTVSKGEGDFLNAPLGGRRAIQIFASDISETAINKARAGIYSKAEVTNVSEDRLNNYFTKLGDRYQVNKAVRDMCVFANHNFLKDPPFAKMDFISCRNVLIYMDTILQKKALTTFHYALKENGTLLLGKSETASAASELFTFFDKQRKIYSRKPGSGRFMRVATGGREETLTTQNTDAKKEPLQTDFRNSANAILISKSPAAVIINEAIDIVHIHGDITPFLSPPPGKPSFNLLKMARGGLALELRSAIHRVKTKKASVIKEDIAAPPSPEGQIATPAFLVTIEVIPLSDTIEPHYLILFTKKDITAISFPLGSGGDSSKSSPNSSVKGRDKVSILEKELAHTREEMLSISQAMEAANEELQTVNEQLQSSNEELQSLIEELETSGEELQSSNEELSSLNLELIDREEQLNAARDYSEAIVSTIKEPLLILDKNYRVKSANASFYKKFNITKTEIEGRLFYEVQNHRWNQQELRKLLENILPQKSRMDDFEMILGERTLLLNAREIISEKTTEQLILLAIEDVTDTRLAKRLKASETKLRDFIMQAPAVLALLKGPEHRFELINPLYTQLIGNREVIGKTVLEAIPEIKAQGFIDLLDNVYNTGVSFIGQEMPVIFNKGTGTEQFYMNFTYQAFKNEEGETEGILVFAYDVTEQATARKLIQASELFNRTVLESSPDCVKVLDVEGRIQFMNFNGLCQMEIDDFSTVRNTNWWTLWGSENEALVQAAIDKALTGETVQFTALCPTVKGTPKWWDVVVSPVGKPGEAVQQIISVSRDVTEQRRSEEASEKMAAHLKLATDSANVGTWSLNIPTQKLAWSALHKRMWGYDEHQEGLIYEDWHKIIIAGDKEKAFKKVEESRNNHTLYEVEYRIERANDDVIRWMKSVGQYHYNAAGEAVTLTGISIDITEQKDVEKHIIESEAKFRVMAETIPHMIWTATPDGKKNFFNQYFLDYTGLSVEDLNGDGWQETVFSEDLEKELQQWHHTIATGKDLIIETRIRRHDETYRWHLCHSIPQKDKQGNIIGWLGTNTEIEDQKIKEQQKDEFISIASHEMKTPLTTAKGYIQLLLLSLPEEIEAALYATKANQAIERLNNLVTELLDASKIQNGQLNYTITTFDFNSLVNETIENYQLIAKNHDIQISGNCSRQITGDSERLQQVLINLLSNAVKYSPNANSVLVKIEEHNDKIQVSVQDFGVGMPIQHLDKIFDRYYRVQEHAIHFQGLGIGLYVSNNIIERHEGKMWAESEPGKGSIFYFTLPV